MIPTRIALVTEHDLTDLLALMRGYCDFYEVTPTHEALAALARSLLADREHEGLQLIARDLQGRPLGFATLYWSWSTLSASRLAIMNDLFVSRTARGNGVGEALIDECRSWARRHGATRLTWQTAKDNERAQKLYDRMGAERSEWLDYSIDTSLDALL
jgi:GNAT superfamily N-acetyltransferase